MKHGQRIFLILFLFCIKFASAQTYFPMPTVKAEWKTERCFYLYTSGLYDEYTIYTTGEDTLLYQKTYKKLFKKAHHWPGSANDTTYTDFIGGYREANKKVYMLCPPLTSPDTNERLIYDFSPAFVGDTIFAGRISYNDADTMNAHVVTDIDSVLVGGEFHRRVYLTNLIGNYFPEFWVEGVGSNFGLIYASYNAITSNSYDMICFSENDSLKYQNSSPSFGYCTAPLPPASCDSTTTSVQGLMNSSGILKVYPNPCSGNFTISFQAGSKEIQIFNSYGELIKDLYTDTREDHFVSLDDDGLYLIRIISGNKLFTTKIIVVK